MRVEGGEVLARPGDAAALLHKVQLFCRDFSAAGEQVRGTAVRQDGISLLHWLRV